MINFKVLFLTLNFLVTANILGAVKSVDEETHLEDLRYFEVAVDKFNKDCLDKNGEFKPNVYVGDYLDYCVAEAKYIQEFYGMIGQYIDENPEGYKGYLSCLEQKNERKLAGFIEDVSKASEQMSCTEKDKLEIKNKCSEQFACNMYRSLNAAVEPLSGSMFTRPIKRKVNSFTKTMANVSSTNTSKCLDSKEGNCLTEILTAFVGNMVSTASSLWDLTKSGVSSLFDIPSYFSKKADNAHLAATQKMEDVNKFKNDTGGFFMDKINNFKYAVDTFVKSSVFCQEWEGTPHLSKCQKPLEKYDCLDCNDGVNAFCAAAGALVSEVGMVFLTGGVGNIAAMSARVGARAMSELTVKVSSKLKTVAPGLKKPASAAKEATAVAATAKLGAKTSKVLLIANTAKILGKNSVLKAISAIKIAGEATAKAAKASVAYAKETKVVKATKYVANKAVQARDKVDEVIDIGTSQIKMFSKAEKAGLKVSDAFARKVLKAKTNHHVRSSRYGRGGSKVRSGGKGVERAHSQRQTRDNVNNPRERRDIRERESRDVAKGEKNPRKDKSTTEPKNERKPSSENTGQQQQQQRKSAGQDDSAKRQKQERKKAESEKREKEKREAAKREEEKKHHEEEESKAKKLAQLANKKAAAALAAVQAAGAVSKMSEVEVNREITRALDKKEAGAFDAFTEDSKSVDSAMQALGMNPGTDPSSKEYQDQAKKMKDFYSGANKHSVVESIRSQNPGMSYSDANDAFESRKKNVNSALDYVNKKGQISEALTKKKQMQKQIAAQKAELQKQIADIKAIKSGQSAIADERAEIMSTPYPQGETRSSRSVASSRGTTSARRAPSSVSSGSSSSGFGSTGSGSFNNGSSSQEGNQNLSAEGFTSEEEAVAEGEEVVESEEKTEEEVVKEEEKEKSSSSELKSLLRGLNGGDPEVVENAQLEWNATDVASVDKAGELEKRRLAKFKRQNPKVAGKKETLRGAKVSIETYSFPNQKPFHFRVANGSVFIITAEDANILKEALE